MRLLATFLLIAPALLKAQPPSNSSDTKPSGAKVSVVRPIEIQTKDAKSTESDAPAAKLDYSKEAFVVENDITKIRFENDGTSVHESSARIRIQSDAGVQRYSVLTLPYEKAEQSLEIDYVRVVKPDGTVVKTPLDDVQDMPSEITRQAPFYSDAREKHIAVKGLSPGDVLEMRSILRTTNPMISGQFWLAYQFMQDAIVLDEEVEINIPRTRQVKWKSPEVNPTIHEEGDRRILTWKRTQLKTKSQDEEKKDQEEKLYQMGRGRLPAPDLQISTFQSWEEIGNWYNSLQKERVKPTDEIRAKAVQLTKNAADDNAKTRAIYDYVSTQFHYIGVAFGIGRYQPHFAAEVMDNQYGDCKDKHTLLASLLEAAGIHAGPALINSLHQIDADVPSPAQFDHVITAVPQGDHVIWLDSTAEVAPYGYLLGVLRDKQALVMPPDKAPALVTTPADPPERAAESFVMNATLKDDGTLDGKVTREDTNSDVDIMLRAAFRNTPMTQWQTLVQRVSYATGFSGDVNGVTAGQPEKIQEPFRISYTYTRKDFPDWANRKVAAAVPPFMLPPYDPKPVHAVWLGSPQEIHFESHVELPKGYSPDLPANVDLKEDFAEYHSVYSVKDGVLSVDRHMTTKLREVPESEFEAYKKFSKAVGDEYGSYVSVESGKASTRSYQDEIWDLPYSDTPEAARLYDQAKEEYQKHNLQGEIDALKRALEIDPKFTRAWLWLGEIYRSMGRSNEALDAYRKAIAADPQQPVSYKALGHTLMSLQRYEEAAATWRQLVKLLPGNIEGLSELASALAKTQRYGEAAATLESAIKIAPDRASLYGQLGYAYMKAGDDDKGLEAYKKELSLDSRSNIYNDIAYLLALDDKFLPTALEYAQKAVKDEEEASAKVALSDLTLRDVNHTLTLAVYWDTLGWVYFTMGNVDLAQKYLRAAWALDQQPEVGDHIGQIYEQQHDKKNALHMYRLALSASPAAARMGEVRTQIREHIERVGGNPDDPLSAEIDELNRMRTFKMAREVPGANSAEFFVLLGPDGKMKDSKYISGSEALKAADKDLASLDFKPVPPDTTAVRLVRRGILSCDPQTGCSFVLFNPSDVRSVK
ncbi:MAG TPA: DUF3857 domain-containing protein [Terriglobales bacterium]